MANIVNTVYLSLGSNMGDRLSNLKEALSRLAAAVKITRCSAVYDTAPWGNTEQPRFLNMVCQVETLYNPEALLIFLKGIEAGMGRKQGPANSPRPVDIDILFFNESVINAPALVIPHQRIAERVFVLLPLADIAPELRHPVTGKTVRTMLSEMKWTEADAVRLPDSKPC